MAQSLQGRRPLDVHVCPAVVGAAQYLAVWDPMGNRAIHLLRLSQPQMLTLAWCCMEMPHIVQVGQILIQ
eukprot:COSAG02_NODE_59835_length_273_cov_0.591954_1_plen_69_part_01